MAIVRIESIGKPFASRIVAGRAAATLRLADAMGLLPDEVRINVLDTRTFQKLAQMIAAAGIGGDVLAQLESAAELDPEELARLLGKLESALEESPVPEREWPALERLFGTARLAELLHVSPTSVRRYRAGSRPTPDDLAVRLHFLAKVVGDLFGAYNEIGVRRWFDRPRTVLEGKTPAHMLAGDWAPEDPGPTRVRELARSLVGSSAT